MTHRVTVIYGVPEGDFDWAGFEERYRSEHIPLVHELPGLQAFTINKVEPLGGRKTVHLIAQLDFASAEDLTAALGSPAMGAAGSHAAELGAPMTLVAGEVETV